MVPIDNHKPYLPFIGPLLRVLNTLEGQMALVALMVMILVAYLPQLAEVRGELTAVLMWAVGLVMAALTASIAIKDVTLIASGVTPGTYAPWVRKLLELPLIGAILKGLDSRKVAVYIVGLIMECVLAQFPSAEQIAPELSTVLTAVITLLTTFLIGGVVAEQAAANAAGGPSQ